MQLSRQKQRVILFLMLLFGALIIVAFVFIRFYLAPTLEKYIIDAVEKQTSGAYSISVGKTTVNPLAQHITFDDIVFKPKKETEKNPHSNLIWVKTENLTLKTGNIFSVLLRKSDTLNVEKIELRNPDITIRQHEKKDSTEKQLQSEKQTAVSLSGILLKKIRVTDGSFSFFPQKTGELKVDTFSIETSPLFIDLKEKDNSVFLSDVLQNVHISLRHTRFAVDSLHSLFVERLDYSAKKKQMTIDSLYFSPLPDKSEYAKQYGWQKKYIALHFTSLRIDSMKPMTDYNKIEAKRLNVEGLVVEVHKDKRFFLPEKHYPRYPHETIRDLQSVINVSFDTVRFKDSQVLYTQQKENQPLQKYDIKIKYGYCKNFTNDTVKLKKNDTLDIKLVSLVLGNNRFDARFSFYLLNPYLRHTVKGMYYGADFTDFNPLLKDKVNIKATGGKIEKMAFWLSANNRYCDGKVNFYYHDLEIEILKEEESGKKVNRKFLSFLLNKTRIIKKRNPEKDKALRIGEAHSSREPDKSIVNLWIKAILSGIVHSIVPDSKRDIFKYRTKFADSKNIR